MSEPNWLTMAEAEVRFKVGAASIKSMIKNGVLQSLRVGTQAGVGKYRILDVTPEFAQRQAEAEEHIVHVPLLSTAEVAEVTGHTVLYVQQLVKQRRLKPLNPGIFSQTATTKLFTVAEVRRFLFKKEKRKRKGRRVVKIDRVIVWAKTLIDEERRESVEGLVVKDDLLQLLEEIMLLEPAARMASLRHLWRQLDLVQAMRIASTQETVASITEVPAVYPSTPAEGLDSAPDTAPCSPA